jgi:hypothetical protein
VGQRIPDVLDRVRATFCGGRDYVVREAIRSEPGRETPMGRPIDYIRRWSSLIAERLLTPVMTGLLLSTALVSVIALATHVIVG